MNAHVKTYLTIPLLFIVVALLWSIVGNAVFKISSNTNNDEEFTLLNKTTAKIFVNNVNSSIEFYSNLIGFEVQMTMPDTGNIDFAILKYRDFELMIQSIKSTSSEFPGIFTPELTPGFSLYFETDNLQYVHDKLKTEVRIVKDIHNTFYGTKEFFVEDPNGFILVFSQKIKN